MKYLVLVGLFLFTSIASANDTCSDVLQNSLDVIVENQLALRDGQLNFEAARSALASETNSHVAAVRACKVAGFEVKYEFCSNVPKFLIARNDIIRKSDLFSKKEKNKLIYLNQHNQELARIVCP